MPRHKDFDWNLPEGTLNTGGGRNHDVSHIQISVLMDLRDELKKQNALTQRLVDVLECRNALAIPGILRKIDKRLAKNIPLR